MSPKACLLSSLLTFHKELVKLDCVTNLTSSLVAAVEDTDRSIVTADINAQKRKSQVKLPTIPRVTEESNRSSTVKESSSSQDQEWEETPEGKFRCTICRREFGSARGVKTHISHHRYTSQSHLFSYN